MADKHNPGPWNVEPLQSTHGADMAICAPGVGVVAVIQHDPDIQDCEEPDGETVKWHPADLANAALIAEAPTMLLSLRWAEKELTGFQNMTGTPDEKLAELRAIVARIDGAGGDVLGHTGASPTADAPPPTGEAGDLQTYTAFCQDVTGEGTIWIEEVEAIDVEAAKLEARAACAAAWDYDIAHVHCLGIAAGNIQICAWEDIGE